MKTSLLALILLLTGLQVWAQMPTGSIPTNALERLRMMEEMQARRRAMMTNNAHAFPAFPGAPAGGATPANAPGMRGARPTVPQPAPFAPPAGAASSARAAAQAEEVIPAGEINFQGVDVNQVLDVYAKLVGRTILRASLPQAQIILKTQTPLTKTEAIEALQAVLALNGISLVNIGEKFVKAGPSDQAQTFGAAFNQQTAAQLPDLGSYVTHIVQLKYVKPSEMIPIIQPFAKLPNSILAIDSNGILVLRDYAENVKRMLEMIDQVDVSVPAEYVSEVIPIKYALAGDIASALGSLGGGGSGGAVSIGQAPSNTHVNGFSGGQNGSTTSPTFGGGSTTTGGYPGSSGTQGGIGQQSSFGTHTGGAGGTGNTFQSRLQAIINRASGGQQDQIQLFGQVKIIADQRSNSLLIFATREDMKTIKDIISKLDVLLSQVLVEAVIMDVDIGSTLNYGVSVSQNPKTFQGNSSNIVENIVGGGGMNNGPSFLNFANYAIGTNGSTSSVFGNNLSSGLSYFGNLGPTWDVAMQAIAGDSHASVIQRPRIQTSQAKPAQFFVGETVPYITGYYNNGYGNQSSYSQLSVGVELDVTPFINPDGLVVMDINQEIDDVSGYTSIDGNNVPNTDKRTLSSEIAVRDRDTIMLGGFVRTDKTVTRSGVPILQDIPLLGALFTQHNNTKDREELVVLMRPTVLKTPEAAAAQTLREEQRLPGVSAAEADDAAYQQQLINQERKAEQKRARSEGKARGFYNATMTNGYAPSFEGNEDVNTPPAAPPVAPTQPNPPATDNP